jgi:gamma-carbonic anhydrase
LIVKPYKGKEPEIKGAAFIASDAVIIGDVVLGEGSSVWYGTVIRGDVGSVRVGRRTNIQDLCMLHMTTGVSNLEIGDEVTVGHRVILHGCRVEDRCMIGMGSVVMDNAVVGRGSIVAAGAVVLENTVIPPGSLAAGVPAKILNTKEGERFPAAQTAERYLRHAEEHAALFKDDPEAK